MCLHKKLFYIFAILYGIPALVNGQEYLKELKPKYFKDVSEDNLPPVEVPRPITTQRSLRVLNEEDVGDELPISESRLRKSYRPTLREVALEASVREGLNAMRHLYNEVEPNIIKNGHLLQENHPAALLSKFSAPLVESSSREMAAYATLAAAKVFRKSYEQSNDLARQAHVEKVSLRRTALESLCPKRDHPTCMPASERYRTHDGTCNNKKRLRWGASQMPFNRFLPPDYGDGVDSVRRALEGGELSSSRFVSLLVHGARDGEAPLTLLLVQWGQLLDHDMTSTAQPRSINGSVPSCCGSKDFHPSCFPIKVPIDDPWLSPLKIRCLEFLRSAPAQRRDCILSWREQTNQATSYIDASPIYSSSAKSSNNARVFRKGLLIFGRGNPAEDVCQRGAIATHCIRSGDGRSSEQPGLLALHHVWVHEHNYIATKLSEINLHWSDEKIYQETRRIIGAMFQHITYREFLPIVLGREVLKLFELELLNSGYYEGYDPRINPTVANAFSAAAFRFGHSLVQNSYLRCDHFHNVINNNVSLHEEFQRGDIGSVGSLHRLIRGMATQRALKRDEFISPELTNHLFQTPGFPFGLDLAAINIQRGRDHGLPPYTNWRLPCGLSPINTWEEFTNVVGPESARRISHAYNSVHDIDLFVGGIAERPVVGGLVGPVFACIIAQQFSNSRKGDRFWYENNGFEGSFTPAQLHSIRRVSLAAVLCRAVGGGTFQPHIFLPAEFPNNERLPCGVPPFDEFDIEPWLEQDPFVSPGNSHATAQQALTQPFKPQTTFKPATLSDRIFETKSPTANDTPLSNNKVGFSNRHPGITVVKDPTLTANTNVIPNASNIGKISDKLDLKKRGSGGQVTKQKPIPGVNNKLDKNGNKDNRHDFIQHTTRRTIIVNNIPIELRSAGGQKVKKSVGTTIKSEARIANTDLNLDIIKSEDNEILNADKTFDTPISKEGQLEPFKQKTTNRTTITKNKKVEIKEKHCETETATKNESIPHEKDDLNAKASLNQTRNSMSIVTPDTELTKENQINITYKSMQGVTYDKNNTSEQTNFKNSTKVQTIIEEPNKIIDTSKNINTTNENTQQSEVQNATVAPHLTTDYYDSDIDPILQAIPIEHKRVQRKLVSDQLKDKAKSKTVTNESAINTTRATVANSNTTSPTKFPKLSRTTSRTIELRQYQNRPPFGKRPQKVIVDSANGDSQYEIEINIRQTNKSPKPEQSTAHVPNYPQGHKPNRHDHYTNNYPTTTIYDYYQPVPTQASPFLQNQKTKPPTIIFVNEHEDRRTSRLPAFVQSADSWSLSTKRPLPPAIEFNDKYGFETIIGSPHSTATIQPVYQKPPTNLSPSHRPSSSFSQAQAAAAGISQASSSASSNGNFGSIYGFASANGPDSTFSFNIRPKPDKPQTGIVANYGLEQSQRDPWYEHNPPKVQHVSNHEPPYRENVNSPFSTYTVQKYYKSDKTGPQRKEILTLTPAHDIAEYDYLLRTLHSLSNATSDEETDDNDDYEYDEDYGTSPLLKTYNQDGYLRPQHMIQTTLNCSNSTENKNHTVDDNYVLPLLKSSQNLSHDLLKPINCNFSTEFPEILEKSFKKNIIAEDDANKPNKIFPNNTEISSMTITQIKTDILRQLQRKRKRNHHKSHNHEKIAFAPINILTKPERPDNWVFFDTPHQQGKQPSLPQTPELVMDIIPSAEIPRPLKENHWLDLPKTVRKLTNQHQTPMGQSDRQSDINTRPQTDTKNQEGASLDVDNFEQANVSVSSDSNKTLNTSLTGARLTD